MNNPKPKGIGDEKPKSIVRSFYHTAGNRDGNSGTREMELAEDNTFFPAGDNNIYCSYCTRLLP